ncbi:hypothetical protein JW899_04510 [Candidatus Uhrbacteria bacterium]|nr:hypothetical protein [Candidatus Uhrbacteria bacterium]
MKSIPIEPILARLLARNGSVGIPDLNRAADLLYKAFRGGEVSIFVQKSRDNIFYAVERHKAFRSDGSRFWRGENWSDRSEQSFDWKIPEDIREKVIEVLDSYVEDTRKEDTRF